MVSHPKSSCIDSNVTLKTKRNFSWKKFFHLPTPESTSLTLPPPLLRWEIFVFAAGNGKLQGCFFLFKSGPDRCSCFCCHPPGFITLVCLCAVGFIRSVFPSLHLSFLFRFKSTSLSFHLLLTQESLYRRSRMAVNVNV